MGQPGLGYLLNLGERSLPNVQVLKTLKKNSHFRAIKKNCWLEKVLEELYSASAITGLVFTDATSEVTIYSKPLKN